MAKKSTLSGQRKKAEIIRLFDDASDELHQLLNRKLGNRQEAEEIAQDAFEKLCRLAEREDIEDLRKYFFTMANRLALNALRRRQVEGNYLLREQQNLDNSVSGHGSEIGPEEILSAREKLQMVKFALSDLPNKTRHVFLLHRFEGYTYPEIANQLGLSTKAVEYHMTRALIAVVGALEGENDV